MSSASSTARWIDCTVDSMLTTTPFLRPREGCEPMPITSSVLSACNSPTMATTLEVPMSSPTMRLRSVRLSIRRSSVVLAVRDDASRLPADGETVCVAKIDVADVGRALGDERHGGFEKAVETLVDFPAAELDRHAVREVEFPAAAIVEPQRREPEARFDEPALDREVAFGDLRLAPLRSVEPGQLGQRVARVGHEEFAAHIE